MPLAGEYFLLKRRDIGCTVEIAGQSKLSAHGVFYLSTHRIVFVSIPAHKYKFQSFVRTTAATRMRTMLYARLWVGVVAVWRGWPLCGGSMCAGRVAVAMAACAQLLLYHVRSCLAPAAVALCGSRRRRMLPRAHIRSHEHTYARLSRRKRHCAMSSTSGSTSPSLAPTTCLAWLQGCVRRCV